MLSVANNILLTVVFINFILGFAVLRRNWKNPTNLAYLLLTFSIILWAISLFFFRAANSIDNILIIGKIVYTIPPFIPFFFLLFVYSLVGSKISLLKLAVFLLLPTILISVISLETSLVIAGAVIERGINQLHFGSFYFLYLSYLTLYFLIGFITLFKRYRTENNLIKKAQYRLILIGVTTAIVVGLFANGYFLTTFAFQYNWVGPIGTVFMVTLFAYAIVQYRLFNIKVISVQIFGGALAGVLLVKLLSSQGPSDFTFNSIIFIGAVVITILLIRGVLKEVETREKIQELAGKLEAANAELRQLDKAKSEFIDIASHQLRTPLSIMKGYLSMLNEGTFGKLSIKLKDPLNKIYISNERLITLVADLLDLSRIERKKLQYSFEHMQVSNVIHSIVIDFKQTARQKGLALHWRKPKKLPLVYADPQKLRQVFLNIIDNAVKYTNKGSIDISLKQDGDFIVFSAKDTGIGLTEKEAQRLFQKFVRGEEMKRAKTQGMGLGMYVAKLIIQDHRGAIWAESPGKGKGSIFFVRLPIAKSENKEDENEKQMEEFIKNI
ncbi:MAG: hypothetical protein A3C80_01685 [Candidatus Ryanbacteria bacterium RIFCSPHIGHO2_02_FULL_45_43]|uniref:histidine kinase n=1 Tax=Candidatus Ryanbacteria bacterium RIFCSPHIGHO2_01_45_13 TaxID=1802112 RepID=A0A1G2FY01_9BACT|nr:MAG: hypothetical protein A2718_02520 [Candidatus Ryanbacteria bacterium RIFCSPHIGHO2_01_FULL_44_130]OGZ42953.1 MAG: hypothetical protein A2W41_02460 [Candidatus Ryanbacteria bacterium RIFCSPHIGHO2_01_45_13]OGZ48658.1 MAG: hypothetical protein A3C80_01685 [Candidatus Ryanbacteria bacterium RIFCSPHIGHO2_02_FULL_45_43]OGZ50598.1 MAG: hypothetical protein A3E55_03165 [Candidatus Ryanbacteria bacterium RIFCSPHIGHO2_12_FULL_44_20]OGZ51904.1 MAG: hypothetical protein A3A17_00540 [Candidatus Ryanba